MKPVTGLRGIWSRLCAGSRVQFPESLLGSGRRSHLCGCEIWGQQGQGTAMSLHVRPRSSMGNSTPHVGPRAAGTRLTRACRAVGRVRQVEAKLQGGTEWPLSEKSPQEVGRWGRREEGALLAGLCREALEPSLTRVSSSSKELLHILKRQGWEGPLVGSPGPSLSSQRTQMEENSNMELEDTGIVAALMERRG